MAKAAETEVRCPRCVNCRMLEQTWNGVRIHICMRCGANFFEKGELAQWEHRAADIPADVDRAARHRPASVMCPACMGSMERVRFELDPPLEVERCLTCNGLLLDFEEIRRIHRIVKWALGRAGAA